MAEKSPKDTIDELKLMVTEYAKQQTVDPLKRLGAWVKFGFLGALFLAIGGFLLGLGALRGFQEMDWTEEKWSFVPYLAVFVPILAVALLCFAAAVRKPEWLDKETS